MTSPELQPARTSRGDIAPAMQPADQVFMPDRNDGEGTTQRDIVRLLFKHRSVILISWIVVSVVVAAGMFSLPPTYVAGAKILIRVERQNAPNFFSGVAPLSESRSVETNARKLENEMAILESGPLSAATQKIAGITYDQVYKPPTRYFTIPLLEQVDRLKESLLGRKPYDRRGEGAVSEMLQQSLIIRPSPSKSVEAAPDVILVALPAADRVVAVRALNVLLDEYIKFGSQLNERAGESALAVVRSETAEAETQLLAAEERLRRLRTTAGVRNNVGGTLAEDPLVARLKKELVDVQLALAASRRTFLERSDTVQYLSRSEADIQARLNTAVASDARRAGDENELRRDVREAELRYDELRKRADEISLYLRANIGAASDRIVIEEPIASGSSDWKQRLLLALGGSIAGLLFGLAIAAVREYTDQTLGTRSAARRYLGMQPAAALPEASADDVRRVMASGTSGETRGVHKRGASARLLPRVRELAVRTATAISGSVAAPSGARAVLVTSARPGEGKTFVARSLAQQLAQGGFGRVLLVDAAVRLDGLDDARSRADQSGTSRLDMADFGVSSGMTLSGLLSGSVWTTEPLPSTELQPMYLPAGGVNTPALLSTARLQHFLSNTARHFDWIIVDAGSLGDAGVSQLAQLTDATLVVVDSRRTRRQVVLDALRQLPEGRMGVCGVVLNRQRQYIPDVLYERV